MPDGFSPSRWPGAASLIILVTLTDLAARARRYHVREAVEIRDGG